MDLFSLALKRINYILIVKLFVPLNTISDDVFLMCMKVQWDSVHYVQKVSKEIPFYLIWDQITNRKKPPFAQNVIKKFWLNLSRAIFERFTRRASPLNVKNVVICLKEKIIWFSIEETPQECSSKSNEKMLGLFETVHFIFIWKSSQKSQEN